MKSSTKIIIGIIVIALVGVGIYFGNTKLQRGFLVMDKKIIIKPLEYSRLGFSPLYSGSSIYISFKTAKTLENGFFVNIYKDIAKKTVKTIMMTKASIPAGASYTLSWDGRDPNGNLVPNGVYQYQIQSAGSVLGTGEIEVLPLLTNISTN